ncbi:SGNH/GDSL hydrolase family protein [Pedobacter sp. PWIIR3]
MRSVRIFVLIASLVSGIAFVSRANFCVADTSRFNKSLDTLKIVYLGSSVPYGTGATKDFGYTSIYTRLLRQRASDGTGKAWMPVNKSIGGDNTIKVMARWERDLVPQKAKYVVIALSLGNEGIHEVGKPRFDQFKTNMSKLISMARDSGYVPVLTNCYTRNDFNEADYYYVKQLNLWINSLNVPSVNLLGAVDDGTGKWAPNYWFNEGHPNDAGHAEMSYAIVPSLFDALALGKRQPKFIEASSITWDKNNKKLLYFKPDNALHAFTTSITIKTTGKGQVLQLADSSGNFGSLAVNRKGLLAYKSAVNQVIQGSTKIDDGKWHKITLTHYYARGETVLYCDGVKEGSTYEKLLIKALYAGYRKGRGLSAKNWLFYRSGMNLSEAMALNEDKLLQSSLELYAPLDGEHTILKDELSNLAQSTNVVRWLK